MLQKEKFAQWQFIEINFHISKDESLAKSNHQDTGLTYLKSRFYFSRFATENGILRITEIISLKLSLNSFMTGAVVI